MLLYKRPYLSARVISTYFQAEGLSAQSADVPEASMVEVKMRSYFLPVCILLLSP